jgi:hypothetical protein
VCFRYNAQKDDSRCSHHICDWNRKRTDLECLAGELIQTLVNHYDVLARDLIYVSWPAALLSRIQYIPCGQSNEVPKKGGTLHSSDMAKQPMAKHLIAAEDDHGYYHASAPTNIFPQSDDSRQLHDPESMGATLESFIPPRVLRALNVHCIDAGKLLVFKPGWLRYCSIC